MLRCKMIRVMRRGKEVTFSKEFETTDALVAYIFKHRLKLDETWVRALPKQLQHELQQKIRRENLKQLIAFCAANNVHIDGLNIRRGAQ